MISSILQCQRYLFTLVLPKVSERCPNKEEEEEGAKEVALMTRQEALLAVDTLG
jgi:hypothetical protein